MFYFQSSGGYIRPGKHGYRFSIIMMQYLGKYMSYRSNASTLATCAQRGRCEQNVGINVGSSRKICASLRLVELKAKEGLALYIVVRWQFLRWANIFLHRPPGFLIEIVVCAWSSLRWSSLRW